MGKWADEKRAENAMKKLIVEESESEKDRVVKEIATFLFARFDTGYDIDARPAWKDAEPMEKARWLFPAESLYNHVFFTLDVKLAKQMLGELKEALGIPKSDRYWADLITMVKKSWSAGLVEDIFRKANSLGYTGTGHVNGALEYIVSLAIDQKRDPAPDIVPGRKLPSREEQMILDWCDLHYGRELPSHGPGSTHDNIRKLLAMYRKEKDRADVTTARLHEELLASAPRREQENVKSYQEAQVLDRLEALEESVVELQNRLGVKQDLGEG